MISKRVTLTCATAVVCLLAGMALAQTTPTVDTPGQGTQAQPSSSGDADVEAIVNALFAVGGNHKGVRASGAKGSVSRVRLPRRLKRQACQRRRISPSPFP